MFTFRTLLICNVLRYLLIQLSCDTEYLKVAAYEFDYEIDYEIEHKFTDEQWLITGLVDNYESASRPVINASQKIVVSLNFKLIQILDLVCIVLLFNFFK